MRESTISSAPGVASSLAHVVEFLRPAAPGIERQFQARLAALGFTPAQRSALVSLTPGAAGRAIARRTSPVSFFGQVRKAGTLLALTGCGRDKIIQALGEYERLTNHLLSRMSDEHRARANWARTHVHCAVLLTLNEAFASVQEHETSLLCDVISDHEAASTRKGLLDSTVRRIAAHFGALAGALFIRKTDGLHLAASTAALSGPVVWTHQPRSLKTARVIDIAGGDTRGGQNGILISEWGKEAASIWSVPLGNLLLQLSFADSRPLYKRELALLRSASVHCSAALARLEKEDQLEGLAIRLLEVEELERRRIARELHDDAGQSLVVVRLQLELTEMGLPEEAAATRTSLAEIREITEKTILGVRKLISDLSPAVLEQLGLAAAVRQLANRFRAKYPSKIRLTIGSLPNLHPRLQLVIYRVLQECFANISQHSQAKRINVSLKSTDKVLKLSVEDDGRGFRVEEGLGRRNCYGLLGIRQRVTLLGGSFHIQSTPEKGGEGARGYPSGTKIAIKLPLTGEYPGAGIM